MKYMLRIMAAILAIVTLIILQLVSPPAARAQVTSPNLVALTNLPAIISASSVSNQSSWIAIPRGGSLTFQGAFNVSTNVGTDVCGFVLIPSVDGTNLSTTVAWPITVAANGWTNVVVTTNLATTLLQGYSYVSLQYWTNRTFGTLTNKGVWFNRVYNTTAY